MSFRLSLLVLLIVVLAGCAAAKSSGIPSIRHDAHTLEWGVVGVSDIPTLDPALASDPVSISACTLIFGGLVRLDKNLRVQPDGAERWTITHRGTIYTFYIRPGLRFADGRRVTASDFASALERALGPNEAAGAASFYLGSIAHLRSIVHGQTQTRRGITVINPFTLQITLTHPSAHFLSQLAFPASYVPDPSVLGQFPGNWTDHAIGFGPYLVQTWSHTRYLELTRNPYYWGGTPKFKHIIIRFSGESEAGTAYSKGDLDLVSGLQVGQSLVGRPDGVVRVPGLALDYLAFNTKRLPFRRLNARRAFAAVWKSSLLTGTLGATAFPASGWLPSDLGIPTRPLRVGRAESPQKYLAVARYPGGNGFPGIVLITPHDPHIHALARGMATAWEAQLGVTVVVRQLEPSVYNSVLSSHRFDLAIVRWGADYADPQDFLGTQLGSSSDNVTGWSTWQYNDDVRLADSYDPSDPRRKTLFGNAAGLIARKLPILPLDELALTALIRPDLKGVALTGLGTIVGDWRTAGFR